MKISILNKIALFALLLTLAGCNNKSNYSRTTGWQYNDNTGTGFEVKTNFKYGIPDGMSYIEGGTFTIGEKNEFVTAPRNSPRRRITASSFYMDQYEIRNIDWREYTHWMGLVFGKAAPELVKRAEPNKEIWREALAYNEPYLEFYFTHPSYDQYPIVGVTWEQAVDYCAWRTDRVNENALIRAGIIQAPDFASLEGQAYDEIARSFVFNTQKYLLEDSYQPTAGKSAKTNLSGGERKVEMSDGILSASFRLPTEAEWEYAAYSIKADESGLVPESKIYPWAGSQMRSKDKKNMGKMQANFVRGRGDMMGTAGNLDDGYTITAPVDSYWPNDFGLYNMAGNVNEWVYDVYRPTSFEDVAEYNSFRGNVYTEPVIESYDENGRPVYALDSLGRIQTQVVADGDMRSFKDGDPASQIQTEYALNNYYEGIENLQNRDEQKIDLTDVLAPKIDDKTRVYKGGSWKDRAYWLNPSTRRYLQQDQSTNDIGFRCAMSLIGGADSKKK